MAPGFSSLDEMQKSQWLKEIKQQFTEDQFPKECQRCKDTEELAKDSIRLNSLELDAKQTKQDYLVVGGVLDNICNSACQTCSEKFSTKIGSLIQKNYFKIDNSTKFWSLPTDRIVQLDVNGGEPSASKNYKYLLENLPASVTSVRINTNCSSVLKQVETLLSKGIRVTVTVSLDGIGKIHDYIRWPIIFQNFEQNLKTYQRMGVDLNTWTTVSALNIGNLREILSYVQDNKINHSWALLEQPSVLSVRHSNHLTRTAIVPETLKTVVASGNDNTVELQLFTAKQDKLRGINLWDYYK